MTNIRWGILGCGDVAEKKGGPALYKAQGSELVAVMRRDRAKAEAFAQRHGAKRAYDNARALLADPEIEAVYIATPPHLHEEQTLLAAAAGKHVLVEKPMALNGAQCDAMNRACRTAGVQLHVAYYRRFYPKFAAAKALLAQEALGQIVTARLQLCAPPPAPSGGELPWRLRPEVSGGGLWVDVGSHRLDMLVFLLGDIAEVTGYADNRLRQSPVEDSVVACLRLASGAQATASFHFATAERRDVLEIHGTKGSLRFDPFDGEAFVQRDAQQQEIVHRFATPVPTHLPFVEALIPVYRGASSPHVTGVEGAKTTRIMDAVLATYDPAAK